MTDEDRLRARFEAFWAPRQGSFFARASAFSESAEDVLQIAAKRCWIWLKNNPDKADDDLERVFRTIIRRMAIDEGRKRQCRPIAVSNEQQSEQEDPDNIEDESTPLPDELANRSDLADLIRAAIASMKNPQWRKLLELLYTDSSPTLQEVAEQIGVSEANAKKLHERAKKALKAKLLSLAKEMNIATQPPPHES